MDFPVVFRVGPVAVGAHVVFELAAYTIGFAVYRGLRRRDGDTLATGHRWIVIAAAAAGAALGARLLLWLPALPSLVRGDLDLHTWFGQKTIVGALLGGLLAVELVKRHLGVTRSTGDLFAFPLCVAIAVGRVGCFLAGTSDATHGVASSLPWAMDVGDGVARHPTALYETAFVVLLAAMLRSRARRTRREGDAFRSFLIAYLTFRLVVDFWKPRDPVAGLSPIQWACVAGLLYYARQWAAARVRLGRARRGHARPLASPQGTQGVEVSDG